jgi:heptosyltransferase-2
VTRRAVVFLPNWVGDAAMATPALRALREHWGREAWIAGIAHPRVEAVLRGTPWLDETWTHDATRAGRLGALALAWRLRTARVDTSVHLRNDFRSVLVARLAGVRERAGYARDRRGWLLTTALDAPRRDGAWLPVSALDYYLALARALGAADLAPRLELAVAPEDEEAADRAWRAMGLAPGERPVIVNSSGSHGPAKLWPERACAELAVRIARELGSAVVILCGPDERTRAARIAALAAHPRVSCLAGAPLSIGLSKACVRRARCLVSTDSGPRHLGAAFGVPVVALFGPTDPAWTDTRYAGEIRLAHPVPCGPCGARACPERHHACMERLAVETVFRAVARVVGPAPGVGADPMPIPVAVALDAGLS